MSGKEALGADYKDKFQPGLRFRLLTYGKDNTNLNKKHEVCFKI